MVNFHALAPTAALKVQIFFAPYAEIAIFAGIFFAKPLKKRKKDV
jgi:hypothetical protein